MSRYRHDGPGRNTHRDGAIQQAIRRLSDTFGCSRGTSIALLVIGLFLAPLLTVPALLAFWYWNGRTERKRRSAERVSDTAEPGSNLDQDESSQVPPAPSAAADLRERFAELERRAKRIEAFVASEEYRLEREFRRIGD